MTAQVPTLEAEALPRYTPEQVEAAVEYFERPEPLRFLDMVALVARDSARWTRANIPRTLLFAVGGLVFGFVANMIMMALVYDGAGAVPRGGPATGSNNKLAGGIFWTVAPALVSGLISYRWQVGKERFWKDLRGFPRSVVTAARAERRATAQHLLWGFSGAMLVSAAISPTLGGLFAVGVLFFVGRLLRPVASAAVNSLWRTVINRVGGPRLKPPQEAALVLVLMGSALALAGSSLVGSPLVRVGLTLLGGAAAFLLGRRSLAATATAVTALVVGSAVLAVLGHEVGALACDGGFAQCGGTLQDWLNCGLGPVLSGSALAGVTAAGGSAGGAAVGGGVRPGHYDNPAMRDFAKWRRNFPNRPPSSYPGLEHALTDDEINQGAWRELKEDAAISAEALTHILDFDPKHLMEVAADVYKGGKAAIDSVTFALDFCFAPDSALPPDVLAMRNHFKQSVGQDTWEGLQESGKQLYGLAASLKDALARGDAAQVQSILAQFGGNLFVSSVIGMGQDYIMAPYLQAAGVANVMSKTAGVGLRGVARAAVGGEAVEAAGASARAADAGAAIHAPVAAAPTEAPAATAPAATDTPAVATATDGPAVAPDPTAPVPTHDHQVPDIPVDPKQQAMLDKGVVSETPNQTPSVDPITGQKQYVGVNTVYRVGLEDGGTGFYKPASGESGTFTDTGVYGPLHQNEVGAYHLSEALGYDLVPTTAPFKGSAGVGSIQDLAPGPRLDAGAYTEIQQQQMGVLDYIMGNGDRHLANWLSHENGAPAAIDNGVSFPDPAAAVGETNPAIRSDFVINQLGKQLDPSVVDAVRNLDRGALIDKWRAGNISEGAITKAMARLDEIATNGQITGNTWRSQGGIYVDSAYTKVSPFPDEWWPTQDPALARTAAAAPAAPADVAPVVEVAPAVEHAPAVEVAPAAHAGPSADTVPEAPSGPAHAPVVDPIIDPDLVRPRASLDQQLADRVADPSVPDGGLVGIRLTPAEAAQYNMNPRTLETLHETALQQDSYTRLKVGDSYGEGARTVDAAGNPEFIAKTNDIGDKSINPGEAERFSLPSRNVGDVIHFDPGEPSPGDPLFERLAFRHEHAAYLEERLVELETVGGRRLDSSGNWVDYKIIREPIQLTDTATGRPITGYRILDAQTRLPMKVDMDTLDWGMSPRSPYSTGGQVVPDSFLQHQLYAQSGGTIAGEGRTMDWHLDRADYTSDAAYAKAVSQRQTVVSGVARDGYIQVDKDGVTLYRVKGGELPPVPERPAPTGAPDYAPLPRGGQGGPAAPGPGTPPLPTLHPGKPLLDWAPLFGPTPGADLTEFKK